jgi:hypothetical protein
MQTGPDSHGGGDRPPPLLTSSSGFKLDLSRFGGLCLGEDEMQNTVLERGRDAIPVDVFRKREDSLVIAIGVFVIYPLIAGVIIGRASSAPAARG